MCFSATASFTSAGILGVIGVACLARASSAREWPVAAAPLIFALQQSIEGLLWLNLLETPEGWRSQGLTSLFLFFAEVFWPIYVPIAVLLIEPSRERRRLIYVCLTAGLSVGAHLLWGVLTLPHAAKIIDDHIVYFTEQKASNIVAAAYLASTALPLMLSSRRTVAMLGAIVFVGSIVAYVVYWDAFVSVWCFFAAATSGVILFHFEQSRRRLGLADARGLI
jgi:hypothetical protein